MRFGFAILLVCALTYFIFSIALLSWLLHAGCFASWREIALASRGAAPAPFALLRWHWMSFDLATAISAALAAFAALGLACAAWTGLPSRQRQPGPIFHPSMDPERRSFASRPIRPIIPHTPDPAALLRDTDRGRAVPPGASAVRNLSEQRLKDLRARWDRHVRQMRGIIR